MSFGATKLLSASGGKAYEIDQSLMFNVGDSSYLSRNYGTGANSYRKWTFSTWIKFDSNNNTGSTASGGSIWTSWDNSTESDTSYGWIGVYQDKLQVSGWSTTWRITNRVFRDVGAWYHIVVAVDTTIADGSADNRIRIYINGVEETSFATKNNPSQNTELPWNKNQQHRIGAINSSTPYYLGAYLAETQVIDGSQLTPSSFGETDAVTGAWIPKKYGSTYPAYSFYLKYVSGALGTDSSGSGNNYTANNLANADVLLDSPTNNFCTLNSLRNDITLTQGNLQAGGTYTSTTNKVYSTFGLISGKWWVQVHQSAANVYEANGVVNVSQSAENFAVNSSTNNVSVMNWGTDVLTNGSQTQTSLTAIGGSNVLGIALDLDNGTVQFYINGSTIGSATSLTRNTGDVFVFCQAAQTSGYSGNILEQWNFGQNGTHCGQKTAGGNTDGNGIGDFLNAPPSGFLAPCSANLATPAVKKSSDHFNILLYTGNDADDRTLTGVGFQPDLVWLKTRNATNNHNLFDSVRGVSKRIYSNGTDAETTDSDPNNSLVAFTSDGFTVDDSSGYSDLNASAHTYVAWNWKAGGSSTTDVTESGSGTSRINASSRSVNTDAGFSIIKYTGSNDEISNGEHTKLNHGLSKAPDLVIIKNLDDTDSWIVASETTTFNDTVLFLNTDNATYGSFYTGTTDPDSTYIYLGNADQVNKDGENFICYAWHEVEGYSKFGKYEANNSTNGPFINTGFTPSWIVFKYIDGSGEWWWMLDSTRDTINLTTEVMYTNATTAESTISSSGGVDFLSNGFKIRATNGGINYTNTYFYMAFAEFPFKYANAR